MIETSSGKKDYEYKDQFHLSALTVLDNYSNVQNTKWIGNNVRKESNSMLKQITAQKPNEKRNLGRPLKR
jgi:hypothetical protein